MANGKSKEVVAFPQAWHDFYKYNGATDTVSFTPGPSLCRQEFAEECDINAIMRRYESTGASINGLSRRQPEEMFYVDFAATPTNLLDYMTLMTEAEVAFMSLPAMIRREFDNSAMAFVDYAADPANIDQLREWGLAAPKPQEKPAAVVPASAPPASPSSPAAPVGPSSTPST